MDIPIQDGQHYESKRGDIYTIEYFNEDITILFDGTNYRLEPRKYFEDAVDNGRFELKPDLEPNDSEQEIPLLEIDQIGEAGAESLVQNGFTTPKDFDRSADERILKCDYVGKAGLENIREWIEDH